MRSILEKAFIALLNQEKDKADAMFHDFILERSRQIHESLRQGEDFILDESWEQELSVDEMFSEADLADEEPVDGEPAEDGEGEEGTADDADAGDDTDTDADADADAEPEVGAEGEGEPEVEEAPIEDRVADLEAELQRLTAEFDELIGDDTGMDGELAGDDMGGDAGLGGDGDDMFNADEDELTVEGDLEITQSHDGGLNMHHDVDGGGIGDDDFESLGESVLSDLEKVPAPANTEGRFQGTGKAQLNLKSPVLSKPVEQRQAGEPVKIKSDEHKGYEREASPKTAAPKARQNVMAKSDSKHSSVSKEGDKSALINTGKEDKSNQHSLFDKKYK